MKINVSADVTTTATHTTSTDVPSDALPAYNDVLNALQAFAQDTAGAAAIHWGTLRIEVDPS